MKTIDPYSAASYLRVAFADAERDLVETAIGRTCWACSKSFDDYLVTISIRRLQPIRGIELELPLDGKQDSQDKAIDKLNDALYMSDIGGKFVGADQ